MARRIPVPEADRVDDERARRRFRSLGLRLRLAGGEAERVGLQLRRDVAGVDDPADRLALAEAAYLSVFQALPPAPGERAR